MKIAIMTNFLDLNEGYSLVSIVKDQCRMLTRYGNEVVLFVSDKFKSDTTILDVEISPTIPSPTLIDYSSMTELTKEHIDMYKELGIELAKTFKEKEIDIAFTHDWIFTGWNLPYGMAVIEASRRIPRISWLHWVHSVPSTDRDWWTLRTHGPMHKIVFPNSTEHLKVVSQYKCNADDVKIIPHIKDIRTWYDFDQETWEFIDKYPGIMQADIVKIYPASTDRLDFKQLEVIIRILGQMKKKQHSVCLVVANQWANTGRNKRGHENEKKSLNYYFKVAQEVGLELNKELIFTSEYCIEYEQGISKSMLRELQLCGNLFIFPTKQESFGLVAPEAAFSGAFMVLNRSLPVLTEVMNGHGIYIDFGSIYSQMDIDVNEDRYTSLVASIILSRMFLPRDSIVRTRTHCRTTLNMDILYRHVYEPLMDDLMIQSNAGDLPITYKKEKEK